MTLEAGLQVDYVPLAAQASARWDGVLGVATFDGAPEIAAKAPAFAAKEIPVAEIRTPVLGSSGEICEVWRTRQRVESGQLSRVQYRRGDDVLFGCISVSETERENSSTSGLHAATEEAYREIFATLDELAYPHLLRVWNYLPQINIDTHGLERYRQFNSARRNALAAYGRNVTGNVPAACALGSVTGSPLVIYFLASREAPTAIENPRQVSAYEYPAQYGPKPAFSRASVLREASGAILFISGTASIVGHQTVHAGDVAAQTRETLVNIEALLAEANRVSGARRFGMETLAYKVYVRNSADLPLIQSQLHSALGSQTQVVYLQADICRQDLLVEIEAIGREHDCD
ncbi:MAG: chorismate lyase / 3-hydroxybenzoate synthase [Gammaproteobacteria bacterium]|jgi:enamine deaminase RidA (YjgF/YER057c/UK114 family)|nr:chorismate lyase / 3-hydroxybenzoate synthase [Gammaproteobacteria bacterium]